MTQSTYGGGISSFFVVGPRAAPRDKKGQAEAPKTRRGHVRKRKSCTLPVYTSSASPHTTQPARALKSCPTTRCRVAAPSPPASPASSITSFTHTRGAPPAPQLDVQPAPPHAHRRTNESCHVRSCNDSLCGRPPSSTLYRVHDPGRPRNIILPAQLLLMSLHGAPVQRSLSITRAHNRQTPAMRRGLALAATPNVLESLPRPRGQYSLQLAPFFFYP